jgi:hypothetical protein
MQLAIARALAWHFLLCASALETEGRVLATSEPQDPVTASEQAIENPSELRFRHGLDEAADWANKRYWKQAQESLIALLKEHAGAEYARPPWCHAAGCPPPSEERRRGPSESLVPQLPIERRYRPLKIRYRPEAGDFDVSEKDVANFYSHPVRFAGLEANRGGCRPVRKRSIS